MDGPRRHQIGHDVRHAISGVVIDAEVQFLRRRFRGLPLAFVSHRQAAIDGILVGLIDARAVAVDGCRQGAEAVLQRERDAARGVVLELRHADENVRVLVRVVQVVGRDTCRRCPAL